MLVAMENDNIKVQHVAERNLVLECNRDTDVWAMWGFWHQHCVQEGLTLHVIHPLLLNTPFNIMKSVSKTVHFDAV